MKESNKQKFNKGDFKKVYLQEILKLTGDKKYTIQREKNFEEEKPWLLSHNPIEAAEMDTM